MHVLGHAATDHCSYKGVGNANTTVDILLRCTADACLWLPAQHKLPKLLLRKSAGASPLLCRVDGSVVFGCDRGFHHK